MNDFQGVEQTVKKYFTTTYNQDGAGVREVFHPEAQLVGVIGDKHLRLSVDDFVTRVEGQGQDYPLNKIIKAISVNRNLAHAEVYVQVGEMFFTDFLTLIKENGEWRITHKAFISE